MPRRDGAFRSGRLPDVNRGNVLGRRGKGRAGARATMDLGRLARGTELGVSDRDEHGGGQAGPAQLRAPSMFGSFIRSLFSRSENHDTRPVPRDGIAPPSRRFGNISGAIGGHSEGMRSGRAAAASSLGSLQSYATSTIRGGGGGCLSPASTSEVDVRKRVMVRRDESERQVFSATTGGLMSARAPQFDYPNFALAEYGGADTWASDVFVLLHNAIRWEIMDVYNIIGSMQRRWTSLRMIDVWDFAEHWEVFEVFVAQYFEIEDQIIFPFMLNVAAQSAELARYHKVVKYNKDRLEGHLLDIGLTLEKFNTSSPSEVMPALYEQLIACLPKILDYMNEQEQVLPKVFRQYCDPEDRTLLNRACANFLIRATNGRHGIAILTRWIEDSMILQMWKNENLSARAKQSHKKWVAVLETEHVAIVNRFQRRMRDLQKDRAKSGNSDRADRGRSVGRAGLRDAAMAAALA